MTQRGIVITDPNFLATNLVQATIAGQLLAESSLAAWFEARTGLVTLGSGDIDTFNDRKGGAGTLKRFSGSQGSTLAAGTIGEYESARFNQAQTDRHQWNGGTQPDFAQPWSIFTTFKFGDTAINKNILGTFTTSSARAILIYDADADAVKFRFNGASITIPVSRSAWNAVLISYDGTRIRARAGGTEQTPVNISASPGTAPFNLGALNNSQHWDGWIKHCLIFSGDKLADGTNLARLIALAASYGLSL